MIGLAVISALAWGCGNFGMSVAVRRRATPRATVLVGFSAGLVASFLLVLMTQPAFSETSFAYGIGAGVAQGLGWILFARALERALIAVVAPLAATTTTLGVLIYGLAMGIHVSTIAMIGGTMILGAIWIFTSAEQGIAPRVALESRRSGIVHAIAAGVLFAGQAIALDYAGTDSSPLVLAGASIGAVLLITASTIARPISIADCKAAGWIAAVSGLVLLAGDAAYLYALEKGAPAISTAVAQLHPAITGALAIGALKEKPSRGELFAFVLAICGVAAISLR